MAAAISISIINKLNSMYVSHYVFNHDTTFITIIYKRINYSTVVSENNGRTVLGTSNNCSFSPHIYSLRDRLYSLIYVRLHYFNYIFITFINFLIKESSKL